MDKKQGVGASADVEVAFGRERLITQSEAFGEFVTGLDGCAMWWPEDLKQGGLNAWHLRVIADELDRRNAGWSAQMDEFSAVMEALAPSAETKAAYMGEFAIKFPEFDEDGEEYTRSINVPWTTIKEIMAAIRARADKALLWSGKAKAAQDDLMLIRALLAPYAGEPTNAGEAFKVVDAAVPERDAP